MNEVPLIVRAHRGRRHTAHVSDAGGQDGPSRVRKLTVFILKQNAGGFMIPFKARAGNEDIAPSIEVVVRYYRLIRRHGNGLVAGKVVGGDVLEAAAAAVFQKLHGADQRPFLLPRLNTMA